MSPCEWRGVKPPPRRRRPVHGAPHRQGRSSGNTFDFSLLAELCHKRQDRAGRVPDVVRRRPPPSPAGSCRSFFAFGTAATPQRNRSPQFSQSSRGRKRNLRRKLRNGAAVVRFVGGNLVRSKDNYRIPREVSMRACCLFARVWVLARTERGGQELFPCSSCSLSRFVHFSHVTCKACLKTIQCNGKIVPFGGKS